MPKDGVGFCATFSVTLDTFAALSYVGCGDANGAATGETEVGFDSIELRELREGKAESAQKCPNDRHWQRHVTLGLARAISDIGKMKTTSTRKALMGLQRSHGSRKCMRQNFPRIMWGGRP